MNWLSKTKKVMAGVGLGMVLVAGIALANNWASVNLAVPAALATASTGYVYATTGVAQAIPGNQPGGLYVTTVAAQNTNARPVVVGFDTSPDNVTWTTTQPILITNNCFGTTNVTTWTPLTADQLRGVQWIRMGSISAVSATLITAVSNNFAYFY